MKLLNKLTFTGMISFFTLALFSNANAQTATNNEEVKRLNEESKLVADKANLKIGAVTQDSLLLLLKLEEEDGILPADEIYDGIWDNQYVKAYAGVTVPDTFSIDVSTFVMPIEGRITSPFGPRRRRYHYGTDIKLQVGDTVVAAFEGRIRVKQYERRGYGYYLVLRHPNGLETVYGHLSEFLVTEGETVEAGQPIALGGNTGRSTGPHLHFECRFLGHAINPAEIVDFNNFCTFDEKYVFDKAKSGTVVNNYITSNSNRNSKYRDANGFIYHRIREGDTLSSISKRYRVSVNQICILNRLKRNSILKVGKVIRCS